MAPLSLPLLSLLKHKDCFQKANVFFNVLKGFDHQPFRCRLLKRNFGAVSRGLGQLLSQQARVQTYAASVCSSSSDRDKTERLWSVYNETKRQTEGKITQLREPSLCHELFYMKYKMFSPYISVMIKITNISSRLPTFSTALFSATGSY